MIGTGSRRTKADSYMSWTEVWWKVKPYRTRNIAAFSKTNDLDHSYKDKCSTLLYHQRQCCNDHQTKGSHPQIKSHVSVSADISQKVSQIVMSSCAPHIYSVFISVMSNLSLFLQNILAAHIFSNINLILHPLITSRAVRDFIFKTQKVSQKTMSKDLWKWGAAYFNWILSQNHHHHASSFPQTSAHRFLRKFLGLKNEVPDSSAGDQGVSN